MIATVTVIGISFAILISGSVVVEQVFNIPGLGRLIISAVLRRDYPVIQGIILVIVVIYLLINLVVDLSYRLLDPRVELHKIRLLRLPREKEEKVLAGNILRLLPR